MSTMLKFFRRWRFKRNRRKLTKMYNVGRYMAHFDHAHDLALDTRFHRAVQSAYWRGLTAELAAIRALRDKT